MRELNRYQALVYSEHSGEGSCGDDCTLVLQRYDELPAKSAFSVSSSGPRGSNLPKTRFQGTSFRSLVLELNLSLDIGRLAGHYIGLVAPFSRGRFGSLVRLGGTRVG